MFKKTVGSYRELEAVFETFIESCKDMICCFEDFKPAQKVLFEMGSIHWKELFDEKIRMIDDELNAMFDNSTGGLPYWEQQLQYLHNVGSCIYGSPEMLLSQKQQPIVKTNNNHIKTNKIMYEVSTHGGMEADYEEMRSFIERCKKMMDNLIDSREEAYQALQKMKDLGFDDPVADDFEQQFIDVSKKIDELHELMDKTGEYYGVLAEKVETHLNSYYKG